MLKKLLTTTKLRYLFLTISSFLFLSVPCYGQHDYEIYYQSETEETIQLTIVVYGVKEKYANAYACSDAIYALIFDGINGSKRRYLPYVNDKETSYKDHYAYYHDLFENGGFWSFVIASSIVEKGKSKDKRKFFAVNVNINILALRASLVEHNVMRRFGV